MSKRDDIRKLISEQYPGAISLSVAQVATLLQVSDRSIRNLMAKGQSPIPFARLPGLALQRVLTEDFINYLIGDVRMPEPQHRRGRPTKAEQEARRAALSGRTAQRAQVDESAT